MVYEDFTTFTEVEEDDRIQKTATHVDFLDRRDETTYLYKDYGADHFSDFTHWLNVYRDTHGNGSFVCFWLLANVVKGEKAMRDDHDAHIFANFGGTLVGSDLSEVDSLGNKYSAGWEALSLDTWYYVAISKSGTTLTLDIYSTEALREAGGDGDVRHATLTLHEDYEFRYLYVGNTYDDATADRQGTSDFENLWLGPVAYKVTVAEVLGMVDGVSKKAAYKQTAAEKLGMVDDVAKKKAMYVAAAEKLGLKDAVAKKAAYKQTVAEKLGLLDDVTKKKAMYVAAAEKLGLVDDYFKRVTAGILGDNPDNVGSRGSPIYKDMPDYMGAVYVNTKNTWQDAENLDDAHGYTSYMWIPEEMFSVKIMKLHVYAEKFRAHSKAAKTATPSHTHDVVIGAKTSAGGGAHSHSVTGATSTSVKPDHTHNVVIGTKTSYGGGVHKHVIGAYQLGAPPAADAKVILMDYNEAACQYVYAYKISVNDPYTGTTAAHTHDVNIGTPTSESGGASHAHSVSGQTASAVGTHTHSVNYGTKTSESGAGAHGHDIDYGIYEEAITGRTLSAKLYDPKDNLLKDFGVITTGEEDVILDLSEYFETLKYGMYRLELTASGRIRARLVYYELGIMFAM